MKQIIQDLKTGQTLLADIPAPMIRKGAVLIQTTRSLVSLGTERMLVEFGKANLIDKARQQPDKVKQVLEKIKSDGLIPTLEAVFNKLGQPLPLGYCNVGVVREVGEGVEEFKVGDRVASNGPHAEYVVVPKNLVAKIPENVSDDAATFTVIGSIGLQGIRLLNPTMGETVVVVGLGLIGLLAAELLVLNGCNVIGIDFDERKLELARKKGVVPINGRTEDVVSRVEALTSGVGADGVLITASAKGNDIISQSAKVSRKRGRIVLVGVIGLDISRADFYEKELSFQVSCSYGPGRYDDMYEQRGIDYPLPYVRWTEKRNFETILSSMASGRLDVNALITENVSLSDFDKIYGEIGTSTSIASILEYPQHGGSKHSNVVQLSTGSFSGQNDVVGVIGAGNFTKMNMMPAISGLKANLKYIASASGVSGTMVAKKYGFTHSTTDYRQIITDPEVKLVIITTRHNQHADQVVETLNEGKHVFVEKPLALNAADIERIVQAQQKSGKTITVGYNRRFSPHVQKIKSMLSQSGETINMIATMNAGFIPGDHWVHDMNIGGGRIIGEACHFIDLLVYLNGSKVVSVCMNAMGEDSLENTDNASILLRFENGSNGVINYFANGSKAYSKERVEVYSSGRTAIIDNFRKTTGFGFKGFSALSTRQDKGHKAQFTQLFKSLKEGGPELIPLPEIINVSMASFAAIESLKTKQWINI